MTTETPVEDRLEEAVALREQGHDVEARSLLLELHDDAPDDARVNLQCAWIHDKLGLETEAVPFYERAISAGLAEDDLNHALVGLGSTYRALGRYDDALETLSRAAAEFPDDTGIQVFLAMALYNTGAGKDAVERLLSLLVETTADPAISRYRAALTEYAADVDRTWA
jgi:tetratricopeptide (TPR) repeat protein